MGQQLKYDLNSIGPLLLVLGTIVHSSGLDVININFRAVIRPKAALEEDFDVLEDEVAALLHLEGEGVAAVPCNDEEETLVEVKEEFNVGRNN